MASWSTDFQKERYVHHIGDFATAFSEFKPLAEQGFFDVQGNLGAMYAFGSGILKDYVYAHMLGNIAETNGIELGSKLRNDFKKLMSPSKLKKYKSLPVSVLERTTKVC